MTRVQVLDLAVDSSEATTTHLETPQQAPSTAVKPSDHTQIILLVHGSDFIGDSDEDMRSSFDTFERYEALPCAILD
jgi:hypothetical protein